MDEAETKRLFAEVATLRSDIRVITERLNVVLASIPRIPADAIAAHAAREAAEMRGFFWVPEFAAVIGRHRQFVSDRCAARVIKTLKGGKPYRIPLDEATRWNSSD